MIDITGRYKDVVCVWKRLVS